MKNQIEKMYMHVESGDVASYSDWETDFNSMDVESWFGLPFDECDGKHFLDTRHLIEVEMLDGGWQEV